MTSYGEGKGLLRFAGGLKLFLFPQEHRNIISPVSRIDTRLGEVLDFLVYILFWRISRGGQAEPKQNTRDRTQILRMTILLSFRNKLRGISFLPLECLPPRAGHERRSACAAKKPTANPTPIPASSAGSG